MNDLDQIFRDCVNIPDAFFGDPNLPDYAARKGAVIRAARCEFDTLIHRVRAILTAPRAIPARERNAAMEKIKRYAEKIQEVLEEQAEAIDQAIGIVGGRAIDIGGDKWHRHQWLQKFSRDLDTFIELADRVYEPTKGGRPENKQRVVALARIAAFFETWTGRTPSTAEESRFSRFATAIFQHLGFEDTNDMAVQIAKIVTLRKAGANLETFAG